MNMDTTDLWRAKFAWFWYNDAEIWHFTQDDMDAKMKVYADQGITHIITFSCTHFRWTFKPWWPQINECLKKVCTSAHKFGIKVIEHHSACLKSWPINANGEFDPTSLERELKGRNSTIPSWPGIMEYLESPDNADDRYCQVDAVTGKNVFSGYYASAKCPNNPEYIREYLAYLETVYATGVDGIMTDDMYDHLNCSLTPDGKRQYKARSCGCKYCRQLFKEQYGYELPAPDKWDAWYGSMDDKSFMDFLDFRRKSYMNFHNKVREHYTALGYKMLRPNYDAANVRSDNEVSLAAEFPALDLYFQECMYALAGRYSWMLSLGNQKMNQYVSRRRDIPHMMMFYSDSVPKMTLSFGVARLAGAMFTNTPEGENNTDEKPFRLFEDKYANLLFHVKDMADIGFIDSRANRLFGAGYFESRLVFWLQACIFRNIPALLYGIDEPESWKQCKVLVVNEVHLLSAKEIELLKHYAAEGGTLVITGICGEQDEKRAFRSLNEVNELWGFPLNDESIADSYRINQYGKGRIAVVGYNFGYPGTKEENYCRFVKDERRKKRNYISHKEEMFACVFNRKGNADATKHHLAEDYNLYPRNARYYDTVAELLTSLAGEDSLKFKAELPDLVLANAFYAPKAQGFAIQVLNVIDTLPTSMEQMISHEDELFFKEMETDGHFKLAVPENMHPTKADFITISGKPVSLSMTYTDEKHICITLPAHLLKDYAMIYIH